MDHDKIYFRLLYINIHIYILTSIAKALCTMGCMNSVSVFYKRNAAEKKITLQSCNSHQI